MPRTSSDPNTPPEQGSSGEATGPREAPPSPPKQKCLRCRRNDAFDEDGFCEQCLREIDQACL